MNKWLRCRAPFSAVFMVFVSVVAINAVPMAKADEAPSEVWVCDGTGSDETGLGTSLSPFKTIQKGVDAVAVGVPGFIWLSREKTVSFR